MKMLTPEGNQHCLKAIVDHWAESRIDAPVQAIARYDEIAKLLITIGGSLQAILVAVYKQQQPQQTPANALQLAFFLFLVAFFVFALLVCKPQPEMRAAKISELLQEAILGCISANTLTEAVDSWCRSIDRILKEKRKWLMLACISFVISSLLMTLLLLFPMLSRGNSSLQL